MSEQKPVAASGVSPGVKDVGRRKRPNSSAGTALAQLSPRPAGLPGSSYTSFLVYAGGPVLRQVEFVSFYWGDFQQADIDGMQAYLRGIAAHFSSEADAPSGQENVLRQYGINGATVGASFWRNSLPTQTTPLTDGDARVQVVAEQTASNLPAFTNQRLFLIFTHGITFQGYGVWCAEHSAWANDEFWAICPYPTTRGCGSNNPTPNWQSATSHEIQEALTDPFPDTGWVELNADVSEGGDVCAWQEVNLSFGTIQRFADNRQQACSVFTPELELWHTIRHSDGSWTPFGNVEGQTGQPSSFFAVDSAAYQYGLHLCGTTGRDQSLWFTMRNQAGTWQPFFDAETMTGRIGILEDISVALVNNDMHVCVTDSSGGLWHSIRFFSNAIFTPLGDVKGQTGNPGPIARVSTAQINGELHVCAVDTNGNLWHAIRHTNSWTAFGDVKGQSGNPGAFIDVTAAEVAGELHVVGTTSFFFGSGIWHVIRHADGSWTKFGDVKAQCGNPGLALQLDAAGVSGELQLVVTTFTFLPVFPGGIMHTVRHADGSWTRFGDVKGQAGDKGATFAVACAGFNGELQLAVTAQG